MRILAKKLDTFIDTTVANPVWLNDKLLTILLNNECEENTDKDSNKQFEEQEKEKPKVDVKEEPLKPSLNQNGQIIELPKNVNEHKENKTEDDLIVHSESKPVEIKPILRQKRGRQGRNEVKIYDRIIEGLFINIY